MHHVRRTRTLVAALVTLAVTGGAAAAAGAAPDPGRPAAITAEPARRAAPSGDAIGEAVIGEAVAVEREAPGAPSSTVVLPGS